jgi:serine protease Do
MRRSAAGRWTTRLLVGGCLLAVVVLARPAAGQSLGLANARVQDKIVKIYGAGGTRGLEAYQSGFLCSEQGHVLTAWSYVLDTDQVTAVLADGRRLTAELVGIDPRLELAVLRVDAPGLPYFDLNDAVELVPGDRVLAFSNLYGIASGNEQASLLQGYVSAVAPLAARRGVYQTPYDGRVYIVDAMTNNAGAAGGVLTDVKGRLAGMLGKELRSSLTNAWLNYAIPIAELREAAADIVAGRARSRASEATKQPAEPVTLAGLGLVLLPPVLAKTPAYVDRVVRQSPAEQAGIQPDDLVVMVGPTMVHSRDDLVQELSYLDRLDPVRLTVMRGTELLEFELTARP